MRTKEVKFWFKCDGPECDKKVEVVGDDKYDTGENFPVGWSVPSLDGGLKLKFLKRMKNKTFDYAEIDLGGKHFCTLVCAQNWMRDQMADLKYSKGKDME